MVVGQYQIKIPPPFVPGSEFAGTVIEVADDVTDFKPGMRVAGQVTNGAFAEEVIANSMTLFELPENMSFSQGASFVVSYGTSLMSLKRRGNLKDGETVLITAAAGAAGLSAVD